MEGTLTESVREVFSAAQITERAGRDRDTEAAIQG